MLLFGVRQPSGYRGAERRRETRQQSYLRAEITLPSGQSITCRVTDFSAVGARIAVGSALGLPDTFDLHAAGRTLRVRVVHRSHGEAGLAFV